MDVIGSMKCLEIAFADGADDVCAGEKDRRRHYRFLAPRRDRPRGVGFGSFVGSPA